MLLLLILNQYSPLLCFFFDRCLVTQWESFFRTESTGTACKVIIIRPHSCQVVPVVVAAITTTPAVVVMVGSLREGDMCPEMFQVSKVIWELSSKVDEGGTLF